MQTTYFLILGCLTQAQSNYIGFQFLLFGGAQWLDLRINFYSLLGTVLIGLRSSSEAGQDSARAFFRQTQACSYCHLVGMEPSFRNQGLCQIKFEHRAPYQSWTQAQKSPGLICRPMIALIHAIMIDYDHLPQQIIDQVDRIYEGHQQLYMRPT